jgi:hypothetical protein
MYRRKARGYPTDPERKEMGVQRDGPTADELLLFYDTLLAADQLARAAREQVEAVAKPLRALRAVTQPEDGRLVLNVAFAEPPTPLRGSGSTWI